MPWRPPGRAVAGYKKERDVLAGQEVGDLGHAFAAQVDVEDRTIDRGGLDHRQRVRNVGGEAHHLMTGGLEQVLQVQGYDEFVLDDE